jgi:putative nucleotidyltransferase with HDIG domain
LWATPTAASNENHQKQNLVPGDLRIKIIDERSKTMSEKRVSAGDYIIGKKEKGSALTACLGTCVGITLCDRDAKIGGLLHLLLPQPTGPELHYPPETYASTGMPIFIRAMCDAGASKDRIEACVGGGALVGPVSEMDLALNIGGQTAEIVESILKQEGINIIKLETGGYFSCKLSLDMNSFESAIKPIVDLDATLGVEIKKISLDEIKNTIQKIRPIPQIALKILRMIQTDDYNMKDIAYEARQDQVIAAKVINLSNSPLFGLKVMVDSVDRGLVILGEKKILQVILSATVETMFPEATHGYSLCKGGMFQHALGTAIIAEKLSAFTGHSKPEIAYTAGLLHDIGKIPLDQYVASAAPYFYRSIQTTNKELITIEKDQFGISHPETGAILGNRWNLPKNLLNVIKYHHHPEKTPADYELVTLVYFADLLISRFQVAHEVEKLETGQWADRLKGIGLKPEQLSEMIERIPQSIFQA